MKICVFCYLVKSAPRVLKSIDRNPPNCSFFLLCRISFQGSFPIRIAIESHYCFVLLGGVYHQRIKIINSELHIPRYLGITYTDIFDICEYECQQFLGSNVQTTYKFQILTTIVPPSPIGQYCSSQ